MRFGRFEVATYNNDHIRLETDHANGSPGEYEIPHMSYDEAGDLIYALERMRAKIRNWQCSQEQITGHKPNI
jgi:hypothetical protein